MEDPKVEYEFHLHHASTLLRIFQQHLRGLAPEAQLAIHSPGLLAGQFQIGNVSH